MSRFKLLIFIGIGILAIFILLIFFGVGRRPPAPANVTLEFWGMQDDEEDWREVIADFQKEFSSFSVNYRRFEENSYEDLLVNRLAEGRGPDIFVLKNSWVVKHKDKLFPLPQNRLQFSALDFQNTFVDAAADDLLSTNGEIIGLPIFVDTPALFYNKDVFNASGTALIPKTWDGVESVSRQLTQKNQLGEIQKPGFAFGTIANTEHFFEILSSLILQKGEAIINGKTGQIDVGSRAAEVIDFYSSFSDPAKSNFSWTVRQPKSMDALAEEIVPMALGMASDLERLRAKNPHLNFGVSAFPQLAGARAKVVYADYFFPAVSKSSLNKDAAWQFLFFASSRGAAQKYLGQTGRAPARRDLIAGSPLSSELDVFAKQSLIARSWPVPDEKAAGRVLQEAVEAVLTKAMTSDQAVNRLREQLRLLLP